MDEISPQKGPQEQFLSSSADIAIYGGAAGGGKSWALLFDPLRHVSNPEFSSTIFRRTTPQIKNQGALWDESEKIYSPFGGDPVEHVLKWKFPSGAKINFAHLEHDKTVKNYQGSQICHLGFDELTHFTAKQFWYMVSRNRSMCGVRPYIRATTNPDADSWVAELISWWIDEKTGYPIPERAGILRWFVRVGDKIIWADSPQGLEDYKNDSGTPIPPKSLTFIPAKLSDNQVLMRADPGYEANLMALGRVERERLLDGNWKIRPKAGLYFNRSWLEFIDEPPVGLRECRGWDFAATPKTQDNDPDWTSGTKLGIDNDNTIYILDHVTDRVSSLGAKKMVKSCHEIDGKRCKIAIPQDPAAAGKSHANDVIRYMAGASIQARPVSGDKILRFSPFSSQAEAGNVKIVRGPWNKDYIESLEGFPQAKHDDDVDSTSEAYNDLVSSKVTNIPQIRRRI